MASVSTSTAYISPLSVSFDEPSPVPWPATFTLTSIGDYPFGPPQTDSIEAYVERRYLECLWMPEVLEPLSSFIPSLRRITPSKDWTAASGPHPLHAVLDEHLLDLVDIHKKYRKTIPVLLEKEGDAQDPEEACIWYAWTHAQPVHEEQKDEEVNEEKWAKDWLHEAEKREYLVQILLRMLKLTLPPPPVPKRKRRKNKEDFEETSPYAETIAGLEMLVDRIGIIRQTASSNLTKDKDKALGKIKETDRDWAAVFCEDVLKPLFGESLPEHYETVRYHCLPAPSREPSPAPSVSSLVDISESQPPSQPHTSRSLSRATSISSRAGSLKARSISRSSVSHDLRQSQSQSQSRSRSGSVEADTILDRSRSRSVSFAARSAGGIRATMSRPGVRPKGGKSKLKQVNSASGVGLGKPARITAPEPVRAQTAGPTLLVAETPQKPSRTMSREVSVTGASLMQRFQGSQSLARAQSQRNVSMDKSALEEFMVSSPERLKDDFNFGDMVLETPRK